MRWGFVINSRSGGGQGMRFRQHLEHLPEQIPFCDLAQMDLSVWLQQEASALRGLVVAGGDGTIHWLAHALRGMAQAPLLLPWPLGTGNDCAQYLGWPRRTATAQAITALLVEAEECIVEEVDHWLIRGPAWERSMVNYLSIGSDARITLAFDRGRKRHPRIYRGPLVNKLGYALHGLGEIARCLDGEVSLWGHQLPPWTRGLVWCNIPNYAGGAPLNPRSRVNDGLLECLALGSMVPLVLALSPLRTSRCLASAEAYQFTLSQPMAMQIDGEPLVAAAGAYTMRRCGQLRFARPSTGIAAPSADNLRPK